VVIWSVDGEVGQRFHGAMQGLVGMKATLARGMICCFAQPLHVALQQAPKLSESGATVMKA